MSKKIVKRGVASSFVVVFVMALVLTFVATGNAFGQEASASGNTISENQATVQKIGLIAAAAAFGFGALGAGFAISRVGSAAMGAIGEKPEVAGQALIFVALAEGVVVFGFITALMILGKF